MLKFKKSLGQNLLIDKNIINKILSLSTVYKKNIVEIGPGTGNLTSEIIKKKPLKLILIEKDEKFIKILKENYEKKNNIKYVNKDILKINLEKLISKNQIVFGNLPYNISSQILVKFIKMQEWPPNYDRLIFMFQKEVGEKIIAKFKSKNYSRLSILTNSRLKILKYFYVSKNCFFPRPKVESMVIEFIPIVRKDIEFKSIDTLEYITNILFSNKRKMINKAFKKLKIDESVVQNDLNIDLRLRPENLAEAQYIKIANYYEKNFK